MIPRNYLEDDSRILTSDYDRRDQAFREPSYSHNCTCRFSPQTLVVCLCTISCLNVMAEHYLHLQDPAPPTLGLSLRDHNEECSGVLWSLIFSEWFHYFLFAFVHGTIILTKCQEKSPLYT